MSMVECIPKVPSRLLLLRHAKSDYPAGVVDHDRPLNDRGRRDAAAAGAWIQEHYDELFDGEVMVLISSAQRAQETWSLVGEQLGGIAVRTEPRIYEASVSTLIAVADECTADTVLIVGHNPSIEETAIFLAKPDGRGLIERLRGKYPTCGLTVLDLSDADPWSSHSADLAAFEIPRAQ
jgi:phosphohistidine phosphatase